MARVGWRGWLVTLILSGCDCGFLPVDEDAGVDASLSGNPDAAISGSSDGGGLDAGDLDAGAMDAGELDAGAMDAGELDAGAMDAGALDAGFDAGGDAGFDAGSDAGVDAGFDAGVADAGRPCTTTDPCLPSGYKFEQSPGCGTYCYYDELHNLAVNGAGQAANPAGFDQYALGQLVDGVRGNPDWTVNSGQGPGYAWVGWLTLDPSVVFDFGGTREFATVRVGVNNHGTGAVFAPTEIRVQFSDDGASFGAPFTFRRADSTLPAVMLGARADLPLSVPGGSGQFVRVTLVYSAAWTMIDEVVFD